MKKFKITSDVMLIIAIALFVIGIVISATSTTAEETIFLTIVQENSVILALAGIGIFLMFAKSDTARKAGNGLTVVAFVAGVICSLAALTVISNPTPSTFAGSSNSEEGATPVGALCTIIAAAFLLLHYAFLLVNYILNRNSIVAENPQEDVRIIRVKEWRQLMEEGIITKEEFEEKRVQILGIKPKTDKQN